MASSSNAVIRMETGTNLVNFAQMTNSGDNQIFTAGTTWSGMSGKTPVIRPNGIVTGNQLITPSATADIVNVAAFTANSIGVVRSVAGTTATITRPATDVAQIFSIVMTSAGAVEVVEGSESATTAFSETRNAAGGPPLIAVDSVELGQIRVAEHDATIITTAEIFQTPGQHTEFASFPVFDYNPIGEGLSASSSAKARAFVAFQDALPLSHTGAVCKRTYIQYHAPLYASLSKTSDFVPAFITGSVSSTTGYRFSEATVTTALGQSTFTVYLDDGITDAILFNVGKVLTFQFFSNEDNAPYSLTQGTLYMGASYPVAGQNQATCTVTSTRPTANFAS
jgi:hypothetical protein